MKEITKLGRIVRWTEKGIEYEAGPKHRKMLMETFGLSEGCKGMAKNGDKDEKDEDEDDEDEDDKDEE